MDDDYSSKIDYVSSNKESGRRRITEFMPTSRLDAFADAVLAIVITILVLELPVPGVEENILTALLEEWPSFLAYLISFAFIGGIWISHASISRLTRRENNISYRLNLVMLFFVSLLPFSTSLMATHIDNPDSQTAVVIYGVNLLLASVMLSAIMRNISRTPELIVDGVAEDELLEMERERRLGIIVMCFGVILALFLPTIAAGIYVIAGFYFLVQPFIYGLVKRRKSKT